jgi:putative copper export protein
MCDLMKFYGIVPMLLAALINRYSYGRMIAVVSTASFFEMWIETSILNAKFIFASFVYNLQNKELVLLVISD